MKKIKIHPSRVFKENITTWRYAVRIKNLLPKDTTDPRVFELLNKLEEKVILFEKELNNSTWLKPHIKKHKKAARKLKRKEKRK